VNTYLSALPTLSDHTVRTLAVGLISTRAAGWLRVDGLLANGLSEDMKEQPVVKTSNPAARILNVILNVTRIFFL
jgi:hypothetical protein